MSNHRRRGPDRQLDEMLDGYPEGNSDNGTWRDQGVPPSWLPTYLARRSRAGQYRRRLRRLANRDRHSS